jgi:hypothetical protein
MPPGTGRRVRKGRSRRCAVGGEARMARAPASVPCRPEVQAGCSCRGGRRGQLRGASMFGRGECRHFCPVSANLNGNQFRGLDLLTPARNPLDLTPMGWEHRVRFIECCGPEGSGERITAIGVAGTGPRHSGHPTRLSLRVGRLTRPTPAPHRRNGAAARRPTEGGKAKPGIAVCLRPSGIPAVSAGQPRDRPRRQCPTAPPSPAST